MPEEKQNTEQLRAQAALLLSQARAQSNEIHRALGAIGGDSALKSRLAAVAAQLSGVASELSQALSSSTFPLRAVDLAALESVVQSGEASSLLTEAAAQGVTNAARAPGLATASADRRREVQTDARDIFGPHIFYPYLHFKSAEDEAAFRKREAEAKAYVDAQLAKGTPEGDLNASEAIQRVMLDARNHGAGDSPDFAPHWNAIVEKTARLRAAMQPMDRSDRDPTDRDNRSSSASNLGVTAGAARRDASAGIDLEGMDAKLAAAGFPPPANADATGHGLSIQKPPRKAGPSLPE